jgi:hypothetical protein
MRGDPVAPERAKAFPCSPAQTCPGTPTDRHEVTLNMAQLKMRQDEMGGIRCLQRGFILRVLVPVFG